MAKRKAKKKVRRKMKKTVRRKSVRKKPVRKRVIRRKVVRKKKTRIVKKRRKKIVRRKSARRKPRKIVKKKTHTIEKKPRYQINPDFEFFYELRDLVLKSSPAEKSKMLENINKLGKIKAAIISGIFLDKESEDPLATDLLIVCDDIDRRKLRVFLRALEAEVGKEIKFATMDKDEFMYRLNMFDRFVRVLLEGPHEKLVDKLNIEL
ncbi:MAG: hypothetical protein ABH833_01640 [Parcubacteria group bacterium]